MSEENIKVITDKEELYEYCENVEQLFDKFYLPLLDIHYRKTYDLQQKVEQLEKENKILKENAEHNDKVVDKVNWENILLKGENKQLENIIKEAIKYNKELAELYDIGSMERSNADTNLLILKDEETLNILNKGSE